MKKIIQKLYCDFYKSLTTEMHILYLKSGSKHQQTAISNSLIFKNGWTRVVLDKRTGNHFRYNRRVYTARVHWNRELDWSKNFVYSISHSRICFYLNNLFINLRIIISISKLIYISILKLKRIIISIIFMIKTELKKENNIYSSVFVESN